MQITVILLAINRNGVNIMKKKIIATLLAAMCCGCVLSANFKATPVSATVSALDSTQGTKRMTLDEVVKLSKKGEALTWSDFEEYAGYKDSNELYSLELTYSLGDGYVLYVGGNPPEDPTVVTLYISETDHCIDIRTDDVEAFIDETYEEATKKPEVEYKYNDGTKELTLDDVIELSKKGEALDWADFEEYKAYDSSTCIRYWTYDLWDEFTLEVGGQYDGKPDFILLEYNNMLYCDVRTEDVAEFIDNITAEHIYVKGDANFDRRVDMSDVVLIMQALANPNKYQLTEQGMKNADMDGNGLTVADAQAIQNMLLGKN